MSQYSGRWYYLIWRIGSVWRAIQIKMVDLNQTRRRLLSEYPLSLLSSYLAMGATGVRRGGSPTRSWRFTDGDWELVHVAVVRVYRNFGIRYAFGWRNAIAIV